MEAVRDDKELPSLMGPLLISEGSRHRGKLTDLALEVAVRSASFRRSLPEGIRIALADLVRAMNCYYSNLIEGHDTHPIDIEKALKKDYSADPYKRDLQLEAAAHIAVQQWIDAGGLTGRAFSIDGIREVHHRFCEHLPDDLLWAKNPETGRMEKVIPGQLREQDVKVGQHIAISPGAVPRFLEHFEKVYAGLRKTEAILAAPAAHHRLLWIHPFLDGNGRVARLVSHANLLETLDTGGIWSVARGLARNVQTYKTHLANCDLQRRNDLDGRGNLSEEELTDFTRFFLETCIDQVAFMEKLVRPDLLRTRILQWTDEEIRLGNLPPKSGNVLEAILYRGELPRGDVADIVGTGDRQARRVVSALLEKNVLTSESSRAPLHLAFPATLAARWMPGLFPDKVD
ncbi:MAG: cell filamentation protein Fic [Rhodocyclales bacterium]|nr:cell filamentation protein Fic [Rhodocyclales bacterium]